MYFFIFIVYFFNFFGQWKSQSDEEDVVCRRVHSHVSRRARSTYSARPVTSFMRPLAQRRKKDGAIFFAAHLKNIVHSHDIYCNLPNLSQFICSTGSYSYLHSFPWPVLRCGATAAIYLQTRRNCCHRCIFFFFWPPFLFGY